MALKVALTGNPNVGKTSLYNRVTRSFEHVGNWHGVTVGSIEKTVVYEGKTVTVTDLPGMYSLSVYSFEEGIARDRVLEGSDDVVVNICEVNNLVRNMYLTLQLAELGAPLVVVVNMMDELKKQGKVLDASRIEKELGVRVIPMSAKYKTDSDTFMSEVCSFADSEKAKPILPYLKQLPLAKVESIISENLRRSGLKKDWTCLKVLENDEFVKEKLDLSKAQNEELKKLGDYSGRVAQLRYEYIDYLTEGAIKDDPKGDKKHKSEGGLSSVDRFVLNKYLALPLFLLLMAAIFVVTFGFLGKWLSDLLELFISNCIGGPLTAWLSHAGAPKWVVALIGDGIINGVGGILVFLPQVVLLFFFLALLEDSGYISRVAFMTDGLFRKIGLSGRSVFTMLMGFGCSATALLTARGLEDENTRKKTVLLTPFMSCSARLPVYTAIAGAFFLNGRPLIVFAMYVLGATVAIVIAAIMEHSGSRLKSGKLSFIMEMPPYRMPTFERVFQIIANNAKVYIIRVGTVIFAFNVIIWLLSNFSLTMGFVSDGSGSILQTVAGLIAPCFAPLGFGNWRAVTSLLSGLVAKEIVISSISSLGGPEAIFMGEYAGAAAVAFMTFTLLYTPCIATLGAMRKEIGLKYMFFGLFLQLGVAYVISLLVYWSGVLLIMFKPPVWGIVLVCVGSILVATLMIAVRRLVSGGCRSCGKCERDCARRKNK